MGKSYAEVRIEVLLEEPIDLHGFTDVKIWYPKEGHLLKLFTE